MRPLLAKELPAFLQRFDNFKGGEFRSIEVISPTVMKITLAGQDSARGFDWLSMSFEFTNVSDARLQENSRLSLVNMDDGISILNKENEFAFGVGECSTIPCVKNSVCQIISSNLKYEEGTF